MAKRKKLSIDEYKKVIKYREQGLTEHEAIKKVTHDNSNTGKWKLEITKTR